ncbi:MAG: glycosyltransferase family 4 protein [Bacteroidales bacterium]|nr:glycosyltransferase family 4 protein [Bacteroidales bacterium]
MTRLRIFISAYACEPGLGSEIGVGWHWVLEMSKYFDLWVLTRESNRNTIEPWIADHPQFANIHFLYFDLPKWARFWKKGLRGVRTYYNIWQMCTNSIVRRTMKANDIKIFHHLTYGNAIWRVSSYGRHQFFVWGPIGGLETIPKDFSSHYQGKLKILETVRRMMVKFLPLNLGFRKRCKCADVILCKTDLTRQQIPEQYRSKAVLFTDVAVDSAEIDTNARATVDNVVNLLSVGRLDAWRGFDLAIEALSKALKRNDSLLLTIVGKGQDLERLQSLTRNLGIADKVEFAGKLSMEDYKARLAQCDAVVNASLKEGAVTVSFDSMTYGKPLICLDTTGYTRYFNDDYSVVIPITNRAQTIEELSKAMVAVCDSQMRIWLGENARKAGKAFSWEKRGVEIRDLIEKSYNSKTE